MTGQVSTLAAALLLLTVAGITVSSVLAFWWAGKSGQFQDVESGALSVFDSDELAEIKKHENGNPSHQS